MRFVSYNIERYGNEQDWLAARRMSIGASEVAALSRVSKWSGPYGLYVRKITDDDEYDDSIGTMADWGHRHEPTLAQWFTDATEKQLSDPGDYTVYRSVDRPWMHATLDRWVDDESAPVELKCAWYESAREWTERIPVAYQVQLQAQLYVTGATHGYFAVLRNGCDARWYRMERHERFIEKMLRRVDHFWHEHIESRNPPRADHRDLSWIGREHPTDDGDVIHLSDTAREAAREFREAQERIKADKEKCDKAKAVIQQEMGDASYGAAGSGAGFSWKADKRGRRTFKPVANIPQPSEAL